jgi:hypothetical protein
MAPTASIIISHMELGKPHELPKKRVGTSREELTVQEAEETAKSKCLPVIGRIGFE